MSTDTPKTNIYLVRHGSAGTRDGSDPSDSLRELDDVGVAQSVRLAERLSSRPISRILSSPYLRCIQSVQPLASHLKLVVEPFAEFGEGAKPEESWSTLSSLASETHRHRKDLVVCSHGDVIPNLIRIAGLRGMVIRGSGGWAKGSVWKLSGWDGERFATGSYSTIRV